MNYYICGSTTRIDPDFGTVIIPDLPPEVTDYAGSTDLGRGVYIIISPQSATVPIVGIDINITDFVGLSDAQVSALLPIGFTLNTPPGQIVSILANGGFTGINAAGIANLSV